MDGQHAIVLAAVLVAAAYLGRSAWRTWFAAGGCGSGCGGCKPATPEANAPGRVSLPTVR